MRCGRLSVIIASTPNTVVRYVLTNMQAEEIKNLVIEALEDLKADNITVLDVKPRTSVTDYMVIASGTSSRHVKSLADNVISEAKDRGIKPVGIEGETSAEWILVDLGGVVVHVMMPATRTFYDLERFWLGSPEEGQMPSDRASLN